MMVSWTNNHAKWPVANITWFDIILIILSTFLAVHLVRGMWVPFRIDRFGTFWKLGSSWNPINHPSIHWVFILQAVAVNITCEHPIASRTRTNGSDNHIYRTVVWSVLVWCPTTVCIHRIRMGYICFFYKWGNFVRTWTFLFMLNGFGSYYSSRRKTDNKKLATIM
jgi:hypothetical protein